MNMIARSFTARHHALLFAWLSRAVVERVGAEQGEKVIRKAVRRYGEQRGRRMALRAEADGEPLTMFNYFVYGEWAPAPGDKTRQEMVETVPHARSRVYQCPWHTAWVDHDLLPYGRLYCLEVDEALVRGYNPDLQLDVLSTLSSDGDCCEFLFYEAHLTETPVKGSVMPWDYHLGHLFTTIKEVVVEELGQTGQDAINAGLADFAARYGREAAEAVTAFSGTDFWQLPA